MKWSYRHTIILCISFIGILSTNGLNANNSIEIREVLHTQEICNLANGTITILIDNPDPSTLYSVDNGINFQTSNFFDNLEAGDYLILVVDNSGCSETMSVQIVNAPEPEVTLDINCIDGTNTVNIDMTPFRTGIFPFNYQWLTPDSTIIRTQDISNAPPGTYTVSVTDRLGCEIDSTFTIEPCCQLELQCASDSIYFDCLSDLPSIPDVFLDPVSENREDSLMLEVLGMPARGMCNDVIAQAEEQYFYPASCDEGPLEIIRIFTASDGVSTTECIIHYFIENYEAVSLETEASNLNMSCSENVDSVMGIWLEMNGYAEFQSCQDSLEYNTLPTQLEIDYSCIGNGQLDVNFISTDDCNNSVQTSGTIYVVDDQAPFLECPPSVVLDIRENDIEVLVDAWLDSYTSYDNCSDVNITHDFQDIEYSTLCSDQITSVNFTAADDCQNISECITELQLSFPLNPELTCPDDFEIVCTDISYSNELSDWLDLFGASSNGEEIEFVLTTVLDVNMTFECQQSIPVLASIDDPCFSNLTCFSHVRVNDSTPPVINCPNDITIDSRNPDADNILSNWISEASANDDCSIADFNNDIQTIDWSSVCYTIEIEAVFTASDNCDNQSTCISILTVDADEQVVFNCPEDLSINCSNTLNQSVVDDWILEFSAEVGTQELSLDVNNSFDSSVAIACNDVFPVTVRVDDPCAQNLQCQRFIRVEDSTAPQLTCPQDITFSNDQVQLTDDIMNWLSGANAIDDCDVISVSHDYQIQDYSQICEEVITEVGFQATDLCLNISECNSVLTISVDTNFGISCPASLIIDCSQIDNSTEINNWLNTFEADLSGTVTPVLLESNYDPNQILECNDSFEFTCRIDHHCATGISCVSTIRVEDNEAPEIICPSSMTVSNRDLDIDIKIADWLDQAQATDACDAVTVDHDFESLEWTEICDDQELVVHFSTEDNCNNIADCASNINIIADNNFSLNCPDDIIVNCAEGDYTIAIENWLGGFTADVSGQELPVEIQTAYNSQMSFGCNDVIPVYASIDALCAQNNSCTQYIRVEDNEGPSLECPEDITINPRDLDLDNILNTWLLSASAIDDCNTVQVSNDFQNPEWNTICSQENYEITFSSTDLCQNRSSCSSLISVVPQFNMVLHCPDNLEITCVADDTHNEIESWISEFSGEDSGQVLPVNVSSAYSAVSDLNCGDIFEFSCELIDPCADNIRCNRLIRIIDQEAPEIICPQNISLTTLDENAVDLIADVVSNVSATDNCEVETFESDLDLQAFENLCEVIGDNTIGFYAIDGCDNRTDCQFKVIVEEVTIALTCPNQVTIECDGQSNEDIIEAWIIEASSNDIYANSYPISSDYTLPNDMSCDFVVEVDFESFDVCANVYNCSSQIRIQDTTAPEINCPEPYYVNLNDNDASTQIIQWLEAVESTDNCTSIDVSNDFEVDTDEIICEETYMVEFNSIDACENSNNCITEITIESPGEINIVCPEPIAALPCFDADNNLVNGFLQAFEVSSIYEYETLHDFDWNNIDTECEEAFEIEVSFIATDICGNEAACVEILEFLPEAKIYIPNVFSPSGNGANRYFTVYGNSSVVQVNSMIIFDRWGSPVFEKDNFEVNIDELGWDGFKHDKLLQDQVFSYYIIVEDIFGDTHEKSGTVQLLR